MISLLSPFNLRLSLSLAVSVCPPARPIVPAGDCLRHAPEPSVQLSTPEVGRKSDSGVMGLMFYSGSSMTFCFTWFPEP
ncbi:hypothetical protein BJX61DRAFT_526692 [Aspergillus egyptiacus]|nr:hypothetical protein BJX61DRAFT_526692 [Aspergillus egyptiacus]